MTLKIITQNTETTLILLGIIMYVIGYTIEGTTIFTIAVILTLQKNKGRGGDRRVKRAGQSSGVLKGAREKPSSSRL
jgi:hypothetical protein